MKYFFILGSNPTLSLAEIMAKLKPKRDFIIYDEYIVCLDNENIDSQQLIENLGGVIKIGEIKNFTQKVDKNNILTLIKPMLTPREGKFKFGFSFYGCRPFSYVKLLAMDIKKYLKSKGTSSRWVISREKELSSVVVGQNKLISNGLEIIFIKSENGFLIGKTLAVQPFKELSFRDYGRPARDAYSGMLPPKLARIMINLSQIDFNKNILDPFCGSGTVLTEAMAIGYKNLIGSDISKKAISDTRKNIEWIKNKFKINDLRLKIFSLDILDLSKKIKKNSIDAIITEPYLGIQRGKINIKKEVKQIEKLYSIALNEFKKILKKDGQIVMVWPVFVKNINKQAVFINPKLNNFKIINPLQKYLKNNKNIKLTKRNTIIYGRSEQKIWREIVILKIA